MKQGVIRAMMIVILSFALVLPQVRAAGQEQVIGVYLDGRQIAMESTPYIKDGVTLVPFRPIFEALRLAVSWDKAAQLVTGKNEWSMVALRVGALSAQVNGNSADLQVPAELRNGAVFVPLRFVGEETGNTVRWNASAGRIDIETGHSLKGRLVTPLGKTQARDLQLYRIVQDELVKVAAARTDSNGWYRFDGLIEGEHYSIQGAWPNVTDIESCEFQFRTRGNCSQLISSAPKQAGFRALSPGGNPLVAGQYQVMLLWDNAIMMNGSPKMGGQFFDNLTDGRAYTATVKILDASGNAAYSAPEPFTFTYHRGDYVTHEFRLLKTQEAQASGILVDETGKPIPNMTLSLRKSDGAGQFTQTRTRDDGSFFFGALAMRESYSFTVDLPQKDIPDMSDYAAIPPQPFTYTGTPLDLGKITMGHLQLIGQVKDENGNPIQALMSLRIGKNFGTLIPSTYKNGYYAIGGMKAGQEYSLSAGIPTYRPANANDAEGDRLIFTSSSSTSPKPVTFIYQPGMAPINFSAFFGSRTMKGTVKSVNGQAASGAEVYVDFLDGDTVASTEKITTDMSGRFELSLGIKYRGRIHAASADGDHLSHTYEFNANDARILVPSLILY
ncbi:stalk domain-containing protein [Paenibacillus sp. R14(2021)]|uniref:stalk domain-containing protein n=1 Tax=Paenibacillus sp. R14(2021) TaxID=2859228 RepID=UPI001C6126C3|nr:stalk domain-containing protein [Paenibacillus sp. R14(2021)]